VTPTASGGDQADAGDGGKAAYEPEPPRREALREVDDVQLQAGHRGEARGQGDPRAAVDEPDLVGGQAREPPAAQRPPRGE
jgi:hypothetical protein